MEKVIEKKLCRLRLEKLAPEETQVNHKIIFRKRKGGIQLYMPQAGGEARRTHAEGRWCYWLTLTCPTDKITHGDLVLDVADQSTSRVVLGVADELINMMNNDDNMEKVIASRNDRHHKSRIKDEDVERYVKRELSNRVLVPYMTTSWEMKCATCNGTGIFPKYPQFKCKCKSGNVIQTKITPVSDENDVIESIEEHQKEFSREELIAILHDSLDATKTRHEALRKVFGQQLDKWIDKNL